MKIRKLMLQIRYMIRQCKGTLDTADGYFDNLGYHPGTPTISKQQPINKLQTTYKQTVNKL